MREQKYVNYYEPLTSYEVGEDVRTTILMKLTPTQMLMHLELTLPV